MTTQRTYPEAVQNCVRRCRVVARTALTVVALFWIVIGIVSSINSEEGISSLFNDIKNLLPLIGIIILWIIAWRWEILGGFLIIAFSVFLAFYLNVFESGSTEGAMIITPLAMTGFMFVFIGFRIYAAIRSEAAHREQSGA